MIPSLALTAALAACFAVALRSLRLSSGALRPFIAAAAAGAGAGLAVVVGGMSFRAIIVTIAVATAIACLFADDEDASLAEGALTGFATGAMSAVAVLLDGSRASFPVLAVLVTAAACGAGWTVFDRRSARVAFTAAIATLLALVSGPLRQVEIRQQFVLPAAIAVIGVLAIALFTLRMRSFRPILLEEAEWGIVEPDLVRHLTSTWRRLFNPSGFDRDMWREVARTAYRLAQRRFRQRSMSAETARVQQIEVVRLRTRLLELQRMRIENARAAEDGEWSVGK